MKHILFPTVAAADAFVSDLQARGVVQSEVASGTFNRRTSLAEVAADGPLLTAESGQATNAGGTAEDAGAGAVKGTVAGLVSGAAIGAIGTATGLIGATAATVATGGLALPVILGMAALGSGVGAAVGGIGGAAGVDETDDRRTGGSYDDQLDDDRYDRMSSGVASGGRAVAVDDNIPQDVLEEVMRAHDGHYV